MSKTTFKTNPVSLESLLRSCGDGTLKLPDFQRSWVWGEDRIKSLIASVSRAFPIGALMTLESRPGAVGTFACRRIEGAPAEADKVAPGQLLLDGQQRMTSLYQTCMRRELVETITPKNKVVKRWFYIDIQKAIQADADRDEAIFSVPDDRKLKTNFDRGIVLDLSTPDKEYEHLMFPLNQVLDSMSWLLEFVGFWNERGKPGHIQLFTTFQKQVLENFKSYQVPVITLEHDTPLEAVCSVFEKVNTGGKALDAFELLTAMYAAEEYKLRNDWLGDPKHPEIPGLQSRLSAEAKGLLAKVASTDFLQSIALLHTKSVQASKRAEGVKESELPAVRATRQSLLELPLTAYKEHRDSIEKGYKRAARFLLSQQIHRVIDLPYQTQLVPLAAIFAEIGDKAEHAATLAKIARWFWSGVFGELYGSAIESRFAKDIVEVPAWLAGGPEPSTVKLGVFRADRLWTMRSRLSAAYKGIHALLMREGAEDFRSGQRFNLAVFFDDPIDIHHIFPKKWCEDKKKPADKYDSIINKTPLSAKTNRIIGGDAPSEYLRKLEQGVSDSKEQQVIPSIATAMLDGYLASHRIPVSSLRADAFDTFMEERARNLLKLIATATGNAISEEAVSIDEGDELPEALARDVEK